MGNYAVILVIVFALVGAFMVVHMYSATDDADEALNHYHHEELARDAALTGLNMTVRKLAADATPGSWDDNPSQYEFGVTEHANGATFQVSVVPCVQTAGPPPDNCAGVTDPGDIVDVTASGTSGTRYDAVTGTYESITVTLQARYKREYDDGGIPPSFRNVITSDLYLQLQGNLGLFSINETLNASAHTNDALNLVGQSMYVEGYVTYTEPEPPADPGIDPDRYDFVPNIDYNEDDPNVFWQDEIPIPQIDFNALKADATVGGSYIPLGGSSLTIDGDATPVLDFTNPSTLPWDDTYPTACVAACGTKDNPYIVAIEGGPTSFVHNVTIKGYAIIVSANKIFVAATGCGGGVCGGLYGDLTADGETQVLLATLNDIDVGAGGGNVCLGTGPDKLFENEMIGGEVSLNTGPKRDNNHCVSGSNTFEDGISMYAEGAITFRGNPWMVGGIVAKDASFDGGGKPTISYAAPGKTIIDPGFEYIIPIGPILIAYSEWGENQVPIP